MKKIIVIIFGLVILGIAPNVFASVFPYIQHDKTVVSPEISGYVVQGLEDINNFSGFTGYLRTKVDCTESCSVILYSESGSRILGEVSSTIARTGNWDMPLDFPDTSSTADLYLQFRALSGTIKIYGSQDANSYTLGQFCDGGNNPYTMGCTQTTTGNVKDAYFEFSQGWHYDETFQMPFETASSTAFNLFEVDCSQYDGAGLFSSSTLSSIGCQIQKVSYSVIGFLVVPPEYMRNMLDDSINKIKNDFPFSLVFQTIDLTKASATEAQNSASSTLGFTIASTTYNFIEPGMVEAAIGQQNKDTLWTAIKSVLYIGSAWTVIGFLL